MADIFLIVVAAVVFVLLFICSTYILIYYQHPDDRNDAYLPKLVVVFGFVLAGATVLGLPLDVANNEGYAGCDGYDTKLCGGLNMALFWDIFFWLIPVWIFVLIPFTSFYYEADDEVAMAQMVGVAAPSRSRSRFVQAFCSLLVVLIIVALVFFLTYLFLSDTAIQVQEYTGGLLIPDARKADVIFNTTKRTVYNATLGENVTLPFQTWQMEDIDSRDLALLGKVVANPKKVTLTLKVDLATFYAGLMAFIGWFFFAVFGGIGLSALPLDFLVNFRNRPRHMNPEEFAEAKLSIQKRVNDMVDIGEQIKREREEKSMLSGNGTGGTAGNGGFGRSLFNAQARKDIRTERSTMREFKAAVFLLEQDVQDFVAASAAHEKYNPLLPWLSLLGGIFCSLISLIWIVHISLYLLPPTPLHPFLNTYFQWFDKWFPLFGTLSVAIFTTYLLFCAVKGCFKFGLRFMCISLYPMIVGKTYMSSFMFNLALVLLCSLPVVQFCQEAFADYARFSTVRQLFGVQISNLQFFSIFWTNNIFVYALMGIMVLTALYLWCRPRDRSMDGTALRDRLKSRA